MEFKDYYQTLGVARTATEDEIRKSYRRLARKYHPDVSKEADAEARMKEVNEAYAVLSDPEKRAAYDSLGQSRQAGQDFRPPPGWDTGFEFSGMGGASGEAADFSEFFAQMFGRAGRQAGQRTARGFGGRGGRRRQAGQSRLDRSSTLCKNTCVLNEPTKVDHALVPRLMSKTWGKSQKAVSLPLLCKPPNA